jgi:hypothetical protein
MIFEIPHNSKVAFRQYKVQLKLIFRKNLKATGINLLLSLIIFFLAWPMISDHSSMGYFILSAGIFIFFSAAHYLGYYIKTTKRFMAVHKKIADLREQNKDITTWEFNEEFFGYKDMFYEYKIKWAAFKGFKIVEHNLFLTLAESINQSFIIGEDELGVQEFSMVIGFVSKKLKHLRE